MSLYCCIFLHCSQVYCADNGRGKDSIACVVDTFDLKTFASIPDLYM